SWWNSLLRAAGSRRWRLVHAESVNAPPNPRIDWYSSAGSIVIALLAVGADELHAGPGTLACRSLPPVLHALTVRSPANASGSCAARAPAADSLRKSRRVTAMPALTATDVPPRSYESRSRCPSAVVYRGTQSTSYEERGELRRELGLVVACVREQ